MLMSQLQTVERGNQPYHQVRRANISGRFCACGNPAHRYKHSEFICERCDKLESSIYSRWMVRVKPVGFSVPEIKLDSRVRRFKSFVRQLGSELIVSGHGEYHLKLNP